MELNNIVLLGIVGAVVGASSAYIGSIMVLKRMALVGDALTHVALPGMAIALSLNLNPSLGAFVALTLAIIGIWYLEKTSGTYPEALVGVFFTASLALGVLLTAEHDILEALFGTLENITLVDGLTTIALSVFVMTVTFTLSKKLLISIISEEMAQTSGVNVSKVNLIYMLMVGLVVSLGIKFIGTLLMGALVIIPAVSARNVTSSINDYFLASILFGVASAVTGILIAAILNLPVGAMVVLVSVIFYILSYLIKKVLNLG